ncbi:MAG: SDR family NAD(P)-dependent oxidoreductase, partial [Planctomycetes bacterium]|nr:SDR family NAD(P)-dependent oxidoreductase [Planctomycetota bacterium]
MSDEQPPRIRRLFDAARELAGPAREAFLCRACGDDARLVRRLLAMLAGADDPRFLALGHRPTPTSNPGESMSRTIVLTGCSSGFGLLAAERFARNGDRVYATMRDPAGRNAEAAGRLTDLAERERLQLHVVDLDVCSDASVEAAAGQILAAGHPPDVLVNNAGQMFTGVTEAFDAAELARQFDVNVVGPHRMHRAFLPAMRARGSGLCIEISSIAGRLAVPFFGVYHASKWALEGYSQA